MEETPYTGARMLAARPLPYPGGELKVVFRTAGTPVGAESEAELALFDLNGRRVRTFASGVFGPGKQETVWTGEDDQGTQVPCGVYFLRLSHRGHTSSTLRVVVARPSWATRTLPAKPS